MRRGSDYAPPLINMDPYISVWCMGDTLNEKPSYHWSEKENRINGIMEIDGERYLFWGDPLKNKLHLLKQTAVTFDTFSTYFTFEGAGIELTAAFTSPLLPDDLLLCSRPVTYLKLTIRSIDKCVHDVKATIQVTEQLCLDRNGQCPIITNNVSLEGLSAIRMGGQEQPILGKSGDVIGIDWGYFYLASNGNGRVSSCIADGLRAIQTVNSLDTDEKNSALILFSYDDIASIVYFGKRLPAYWKCHYSSVEEAIVVAYREYDLVMERCRAFDKQMTQKAEEAGGWQYAQLLQLALRQVMAAHKLVCDEEAGLLYISKECLSNGCAATVDVSYPSIPLFLLYNPELIKGMLRPVFRYAANSQWPYQFAPHDVGRYPILNGQVYASGTILDYQMPIEECGNMLIMTANVVRVENDAEFIRPQKAILKQWADYLQENGLDPDNQVCTDDFAGHLAHNCNLAIKAIMGLAGYAVLCQYWGDEKEAETYIKGARLMAEKWEETALNSNGSTRLAYDKEDTFSMKYNMVWDKIWGTGLFQDHIIATETAVYINRMNPYGLPLDSRADYTKSDWMTWVATLCDTKEKFELLITPMWLAYHLSSSRVPMTDLFSTITSIKHGFQHRSVQGGFG